MLARHRQSLILQAVRSDGSARVSDLTQQLGHQPATAELADDRWRLTPWLYPHSLVGLSSRSQRLS